MKKLPSYLAKCFLFLTLSSAAQNDAVTVGDADCYESFFKTSTPVKNKAAVKVVQKNGQQSTLAAFLKANYIEKGPAQVGLKDLDGDGTKELVIWNFTGGAHCCDEFYFLKATGPAVYTVAAKLFAGNACADGNNVFTFNLHESFGYFFTCFACGLEEKKGAYVYLDDLRLAYKNGKMELLPAAPKVEQTIRANLAYIKKLGWDGGVKDGDFDDGRRKALALNLATYYFSFGLDAAATRKLFDSYYAFKDAAAVWKDFLVNLKNLRANMSL